jgi:hypothetical protein
MTCANERPLELVRTNSQYSMLFFMPESPAAGGFTLTNEILPCHAGSADGDAALAGRVNFGVSTAGVSPVIASTRSL